MHGISYRMSYNILLGKIQIRKKQPGQETAGGARKRLERLYTAGKFSKMLGLVNFCARHFLVISRIGDALLTRRE